jgi:hypothetical protein
MNTRRADILAVLQALDLPVTTDPNKFTLPGCLVEPVITVRPGTATRAFEALEDHLLSTLEALSGAGFGVEADILAYDHPDGTMPAYRITCTTYT